MDTMRQQKQNVNKTKRAMGDKESKPCNHFIQQQEAVHTLDDLVSSLYTVAL